MYWVYVLENPSGHFYVGQTDDVSRRLREHNEPQLSLAKYTHKNGPWALVWSESHATRSNAMGREREIKRWKSAVRIRRELLGRR